MVWSKPQGRGWHHDHYTGSLVSNTADQSGSGSSSAGGLAPWKIIYDDTDEETGFFYKGFTKFFAVQKKLCRRTTWSGTRPAWAPGVSTPPHHSAAADNVKIPPSPKVQGAAARGRGRGRHGHGDRSYSPPRSSNTKSRGRGGRGAGRGRGQAGGRDGGHADDSDSEQQPDGEEQQQQQQGGPQVSTQKRPRPAGEMPLPGICNGSSGGGAAEAAAQRAAKRPSMEPWGAENGLAASSGAMLGGTAAALSAPSDAVDEEAQSRAFLVQALVDVAVGSAAGGRTLAPDGVEGQAAWEDAVGGVQETAAAGEAAATHHHWQQQGVPQSHHRHRHHLHQHPDMDMNQHQQREEQVAAPIWQQQQQERQQEQRRQQEQQQQEQHKQLIQQEINQNIYQPAQQQGGAAITRIGGVRRTAAWLLGGRPSTRSGPGTSAAGIIPAVAQPAMADGGSPGGNGDSGSDGSAVEEATMQARTAAGAAAAADASVDSVLSNLTGTGASIKSAAATLLELCSTDSDGSWARRAMARILDRLER